MQSTKTHLLVDETRIITLPERGDRLARFENRRQISDWPFPIPDISSGVREQAPPWWQASDGAWGCRQAHLGLLHQQWARGIGATLILEDDAIWTPALAERWHIMAASVPEDWDMVMLGGEHIATPTMVASHVVRCHNTRRTHAYLIRLKAIPLLIRTWQQARRHIDHSSRDFQQQARVYATDPFLIGQDAGLSDISGNTNDDIRYWS